MLIKILGSIDVLAGLVLVFGAGVKFPLFILISFGIILLIKSFFGRLKDFASWIDFSCGSVLFLSSLIIIPVWISIIAAILILQKGVSSFL